MVSRVAMVDCAPSMPRSRVPPPMRGPGDVRPAARRLRHVAAQARQSPAAPSAAPPAVALVKYYKDDGPGDAPPANLDQIPDATPRLEPLHRFANRPYTVLGQDFVPATALRPYKERGIASWYGRKFHGQKTSIGETYDMYAMTAAHPDAAAAVVRARHQRRHRQERGRARQRPRPVPARPHHRPVVCGGAPRRHRGPGQRRGRGRGDHPRRRPDADGAAAPLPPVATRRAGRRPRRSAAPPADADDVAPAATRCSSAPSRTSAMRRTSWRTCRRSSLDAQVEPKVREANGLYRVYVGPYADRDEARRVADRITSAFGMATAVAPH